MEEVGNFFLKKMSETYHTCMSLIQSDSSIHLSFGIHWSYTRSRCSRITMTTCTSRRQTAFRKTSFIFLSKTFTTLFCRYPNKKKTQTLKNSNHITQRCFLFNLEKNTIEVCANSFKELEWKNWYPLKFGFWVIATSNSIAVERLHQNSTCYTLPISEKTNIFIAWLQVTISQILRLL
jgi:DNA polymerase III delta prime subunit